MSVAELFEFLNSDRLEIRNQACEIVLGLTNQDEYVPIFKENEFKPIYDLMNLTKDETLTAHDATKALINLSRDNACALIMANSPFLHELTFMLMLPQNVNADLCCMLLNNLSKHSVVINKLLPLENATENKGTEIIDNLLDIFVKGGTTDFNKHATFDFLAGVFANITTTPNGCQFFLQDSTKDNAKRLSKLIVFTQHEKVIRRGGCVAALKNIAYSAHLSNNGVQDLLDPSLNFLVYILLPLAGPEDFTDEEIQELPDELQFLEPSKQRESDTNIRVLLVEVLVALGSTKEGREMMRKCGVYPVLKQLNLVEKDETVLQWIDEAVNLVCRDEAPEPIELDR